MLSPLHVDPFHSQEAQPYRDDPRIQAMVLIGQYFEENNVAEFQRVLQSNHDDIMGDAFIASYVQNLVQTLRTNVILKLIQPYSRIRLSYISQELLIPVDDVEHLMICLISDEVIAAKIDQENMVLYMDRSELSCRRLQPLCEWADNLAFVSTSLELQLSRSLPLR